MEKSNQSSFGKIISDIKLFLKETFDISHDTNRSATIEDIKAGVDMKGQNAWVLIFSILVAST
ncbi:MAG: hypothetical protein NWP90_00100, partial [Flavobacterium sp.]|nr:hypothetical protein [Flavobacterium sp.]